MVSTISLLLLTGSRNDKRCIEWAEKFLSLISIKTLM